MAAGSPATMRAASVRLVAATRKLKSGVELHICCQCVAEHPEAVAASDSHTMLCWMDQLVNMVWEGVSLSLSCWWSS